MKELLHRLVNSETLSRAEAHVLMDALVQDSTDDAQIAAVLTVYRMRFPSSEELLGFRTSLLEKKKSVFGIDHDCLDLCGTGGDGKDTINISTLSAVVAAACGVPVVKHGNYSSSSVCGSSNVLESLGVPLALDAEYLGEIFRESQLAFLHAPQFHPAVRRVAHIRKALSFRSIFNLLGPLVNPVQPRAQLLGVGDVALVDPLAEVLELSQVEFAVLHSLDGYDEISLTGAFRLKTRKVDLVITPDDIGLPRIQDKLLSAGGSIESAVRRFMEVLTPRLPDPAKNVIAANAGVGIALYRGALSSVQDIVVAVQEAQEAIESGAALKSFEVYRAHAQRCAADANKKDS
jgi:anthranilate phosphoribosyltransferase